MLAAHIKMCNSAMAPSLLCQTLQLGNWIQMTVASGHSSSKPDVGKAPQAHELMQQCADFNLVKV